MIFWSFIVTWCFHLLTSKRNSSYIFMGAIDSRCHTRSATRILLLSNLHYFQPKLPHHIALLIDRRCHGLTSTPNLSKVFLLWLKVVAEFQTHICSWAPEIFRQITGPISTQKCQLMILLQLCLWKQDSIFFCFLFFIFGKDRLLLLYKLLIFYDWGHILLIIIPHHHRLNFFYFWAWVWTRFYIFLCVFFEP